MAVKFTPILETEQICLSLTVFSAFQDRPHMTPPCVIKLVVKSFLLVPEHITVHTYHLCLHSIEILSAEIN